MSSLSASTSTSSSAAFRPLSETDLERQPEEVFDLVEEIGKGSYGTVHRAILKENNLEVAIKKVQVADELHEIIKGGEFIKGYISQWKITRITSEPYNECVFPMVIVAIPLHVEFDKKLFFRNCYNAAMRIAIRCSLLWFLFC